jgi:hypothetical protein
MPGLHVTERRSGRTMRARDRINATWSVRSLPPDQVPCDATGDRRHGGSRPHRAFRIHVVVEHGEAEHEAASEPRADADDDP